MQHRSFHNAYVISREFITPGMVRIVLGGAGLRNYSSTGIPDEFVRLYFPDENTGVVAHPDLPVSPEQPADQQIRRCHSEVYTIRSFDAVKRELVIDFVVHEGGKSSEWAQCAQGGDKLVLSSPHAMYLPPKPNCKQLLLCDATGLPALARILEMLPSETDALAVIEIAEPSHRYLLQSSCKLETIWLERRGNGVAPSQLFSVLRSLSTDNLPDYVWMAGEHRQARAIRRHLRKQWGLSADRYTVVGYWIEKREEWVERWENLDPELKQRIDAAWACGRDREDVRDEVESLMEAAGL